ncbi:MAG: VanZ family protein [Thermoanaerobaculia bacterium]
MSRGQRILYYWAPAVLWAAVVLAASGEPLAASHTAEWLQQIAAALTGSPLRAGTLEVVHFFIQKIGHLTEYGIFGALAFRAFRGAESGWSRSWSIAAVFAAAVLAGIDEYHQTSVPGRTGAFSDALIDLCGATLSQMIFRQRRP